MGLKITGLRIELLNKSMLKEDNLIIGVPHGQRKQMQELINSTEIVKDKEYDITIKPTRHKRSLNANGYLWTLIRDIAKAKGITELEYYQDQVSYGSEYYTVAMSMEAVEGFVDDWCSKGDGWIVKYAGPEQDIYGDDIPGRYIYRAYYGTSRYDTKQMSQIIDRVVQDAKELGVETMKPDELEHLKSLWGDRNG